MFKQLQAWDRLILLTSWLRLGRVGRTHHHAAPSNGHHFHRVSAHNCVAGTKKVGWFHDHTFFFQQSIDTEDAAWKIRSGSKWSLEYYSNLLPFFVVMSCERCQFVVMFGYCGCLLVIICTYIYIYTIFFKYA